MKTQEKELAHECAEKGAQYNKEFTKIMRYEIVFAMILIPLGIFTLPFGVLFLILGGMCIASAFGAAVLAEQAHKDYFEIRDDIIKHGSEVDHDYDRCD